MMSVATTKTVITEAAMAAGLPFDLPENGHVSRLRTNWSVYEDGALAQRLQTEEISSHLQDNKRKNVQIRSDFPRALEEQAKEQDQNLRRLEERRQQLRQQEEFDSNVARRVAEQLDPVTNLRSDRDLPTIHPRIRERGDGSHERYFQQPFDNPNVHGNYKNERDRIFAERLQRPEQGRYRVPVVPQPAEPHQTRGPFQGNGYIFNRPSPAATPPLPVTDTGDVPTASPGLGDFSDVLPHVRGGVRYNDEQYLVKLARPALVTAEPVYANNRPEHYAVSAKFPQPETGAIAKIPRPLGPSSPDTPRASDLLLGATGLSQKDLALSKKAELQLEQERRDKELALELQKQFDLQESESQKQAVQAQDEEYARQLHEKEVARLKRAKERSKMKKQLLKQQEDTERTLVDQSHEDIQDTPFPHERLSSQQLSLNTSIGATTQNGNRRSDGASSANGRHSRSSGASRSFEEEMRPPARKPYMNPEAIDLHRSQFAVNREQEELREEDRNQLSEKDLDEDIEEPQYANIGPNADHLKREEITREITLNYNQWPVPPYMPLQQPVSKKSTSLEKRIKKRKEKEGCKQQ